MRWAICCLLITGCASSPSNGKPSLFSRLKGESAGVQQASYEVDAKDDLNPSRIHDPVTLKLRYAQWVEEMENYDEARRHYAEVLEQRPENFDAVLGLARIEQASGDDAAAETGFRRAITMQPNSPIAQHALGQFLLKQNRVAEALPLLNQAHISQPDNKACQYHLAEALAKSGDVNAALPHFQHTVGPAAAHYNVGIVLRDRGDYPAAEHHFRQALTINPKLQQARQSLGAMQQQRQSQQFAGSSHPGGASQETVSQSAPNAAERPVVVPAAHYLSSPINSLTPAQREQLRNQQQLPR